MNMSTALSNALSGLNAASRGASVVSGNIANALTPGYAQRSLELASSTISGNGVSVVGITRNDDPVLIANLRATDAELGHSAAVSQFHTGFENLVGSGDDTASIAARLAGFESSLITAASLPDSDERLDLVVQAARDLTVALNTASEGVRQMRSDADRTIRFASRHAEYDIEGPRSAQRQDTRLAKLWRRYLKPSGPEAGPGRRRKRVDSRERDCARQ